VADILEPIIKGLFQWLYGLILDFVSYCANGLLGVMNSDLTFFETHVPAIGTMVDVFIAVGWALLIGNCVFQAMKSMFSGLGFDGEAPGILLIRTGIYGFLLLASRQVCEIGLSITGSVMTLLEIPAHIDITSLDEGMFTGVGSAGWLLVIIFGIIMIFQIFKLLFEIGERYVVMCVLTFLSPLAFAMGGSKATHDIFKGWARMFGSMLLMMVMSISFLKMILSAMSTVPSADLLLPWLVLIVALARVARKIDSHIMRIGLNPAVTGDGLGRGFPGIVAYTVARSMINTVAHRGTPAPASGNANTGGGTGGSGFGFGGRTNGPSGSNTPTPAGNNVNSSAMTQAMASNTVRINTAGGPQTSQKGGDTLHNAESHALAGAEHNSMIVGGSQTANSIVSKGGTVRQSGGSQRYADAKNQGQNQPGGTVIPTAATGGVAGVGTNGKSGTPQVGKSTTKINNQHGATIIPSDKMTPVSGAGQLKVQGDISGKPGLSSSHLPVGDAKNNGSKVVPSGQAAANVPGAQNTRVNKGGATIVPSTTIEAANQHNQMSGGKQIVNMRNAGANVSSVANNQKHIHQSGNATITPGKDSHGGVPVISPPSTLVGGKGNIPSDGGVQKGAQNQIINPADTGKGKGSVQRNSGNQQRVVETKAGGDSVVKTSPAGSSGVQKGSSGTIINPGADSRHGKPQGNNRNAPFTPGAQGGNPQNNQSRRHHAANSIRQDGPPLVNKSGQNTGMPGGSVQPGKNNSGARNNRGQNLNNRQNLPQNGQFPKGGTPPVPGQAGGQQGKKGTPPIKTANNNRNIKPIDPNKGKKKGGGNT